MTALWLVLFWCTVALIGYTYVGYPVLLACVTRPRPAPPEPGEWPTVDVLIAAYNEARHIESKLRNTLALDYPPDRLNVTVVTDGSTDSTPQLVVALGNDRVRLLHQPERQGKSAALRRALPYLRGQVILFTDANCLLPPEALRAMVRHLSDPHVGGVSGAKRVTGHGQEAGEGLYWRYERWLKHLDDRFGSVMGAPGEIWLARREAYVAPAADIVLDDLYASMDMVARGWRLSYEPTAISTEEASPTLGAEWERRARNAAGGLQAVRRLRQVWRAGPRMVFQYVSHRVLRWAVVPPALALLPVWTVLLLPNAFYLACLGTEMGLALAALAGWLRARRGKTMGWATLPFQLVFLNAAALAGSSRYLRGHTDAVWARVRP